MQTVVAGREARPPSIAPPWPPDPAPAPAWQVRWAADGADLRAAQRLRHRVLVDELGARPTPPVDTPPGHEADVYDPHCAHLIVCAPTADGEAVVAAARLLTPAGARDAGGCACEATFDLTRLRAQRSRLFELGRVCVDPGWRTGPALAPLWSAIANALVPHADGLLLVSATAGTPRPTSGVRSRS
jgi:putative hemolysin